MKMSLHSSGDWDTPDFGELLIFIVRLESQRFLCDRTNCHLNKLTTSQSRFLGFAAVHSFVISGNKATKFFGTIGAIPTRNGRNAKSESVNDDWVFHDCFWFSFGFVSVSVFVSV